MKRTLLALALVSAFPVYGQGTKISALPSGAPAQSNDAIAIARSGSNFRISVANILAGNAATATALAANPADCSANRFANAIAANGDLTCGQVDLTAAVTGTLPVANGGTGQTSFGTGVGTALTQNVTGSNGIVLATSPTIVTPTIASFANANHNHSNSAGGGNISLTNAVTGQLPLANGGTGANLTDPNADRIPFWDDSAGAIVWLTVGSGLNITNTTMTATGGGSGCVPAGSATELLLDDGSGGCDALTGSGWDGSTLTIPGDIAADNILELPASTAQGDLLYLSAATTLARLAKDTNATRYLANTGSSNNPAWAQVNVANGVTGTLPVANGGTGITSLGTGVATALGIAANGSGGFVTDTGSVTLTNKTLGSSTSVSAAISWGDGVKQVFNPDGTNAGINVGAQAGNVGTPVNGDLWYDSTANALKARINGSTVSLGAGGSGCSTTGTGLVLTSDGSAGCTSNTTGTGVVTAIGVNTNASGGFHTIGGALGTPASGDTVNLTMNVGNSDTTLTRTGAGVIAVEGVTVTRTIFQGTATLNPGAVTSGTCSSAVTVSATGVVTTDTIDVTLNADPTSTTGYNPSGDLVYIWAYPTADNINLKICNKSGSSVTPGSRTANVAVRR